jgi:hypothetical protein
MKKHLFKRENIIGIIPILEICFGLIFLILKIRSIYRYNTFINNLPEGIKDIIDYDLMRYGDALLWTICLLTGSVYWLSKKVYWILTQTFFCLFLLKLELSLLWFYDLYLVPAVIYTLSTCIFFLFIVIQIKLFKIKEIKGVLITNKVKLLGVAVSLIACVIYCFFEVIYPVYEYADGSILNIFLICK